MRWRELHETPIADLQLIGQDEETSFNRGISFDDRDKKLLQSPKAVAKIIRAFRKTPFVFEVFFYGHDSIDGSSRTDNEDVDNRALTHNAGIHDAYGDILGKPGVIRVVQMSNLSPVDGRIPMTGWILAHKIGHSLQDEMGGRRSNWKGPIAPYVEEVDFLLRKISRVDAGYETEYMTAAMDSPRFVEYDKNLIRMLTMKSARNYTLNNVFEIFAEVVAQYLINGSVKMNLKLPDLSSPVLRELNHAIGAMFKSLEGKILVEI
jgi:hypothetical protein